MLKLMMLTHNPVIASSADAAGIDRIFYDLEYINKRERQTGRNTVISEYDIDGIGKIKQVLKNSKLLVRVNPIYFNSQKEIEDILKYSPDYLMLPMVMDESDVKKFVTLVKGRAKIIIMIETAQSLARIDNILDVEGIDEIFIGLNDLHISMQLDCMFELLSGGLVEYLANKCNLKQIEFGFGGIARIGQGELPADNIIGEHYRLGSKTVILSRSFKGTLNDDGNNMFELDLLNEVNKVRNRENECSKWTQEQFNENKKFVKNRVMEMISYDDKT